MRANGRGPQSLFAADGNAVQFGTNERGLDRADRRIADYGDLRFIRGP